MSIYRSEEMRLCQLFVSSEAAYNCVSELGELGLVQFRDLNPEANLFQRKFVNEVRRCDDMERILNFIEFQLVKDKINIPECVETPLAPQPTEMVDIEATFEKLETELKEVNSNSEALDKNFLELTELKTVLETARQFLDGDGVDPNISSSFSPAEETNNEPVQIGFVAGVIARQRMAMFERMLWRVSRGNAFLKQQEIDQELKDPATGAMVSKCAFMVFFQGDQLKQKVKKISEGCRATMYPCPDNAGERQEMLQGVTTRMEDLSVVLEQTSSHRERVLSAAAKHLREWFIKVRKIKAIYDTLNCFNVDVTNKCLIAEVWLPVADTLNIKEALRVGTATSGSTVEPIMNVVETSLDPPTFHRTNKFTSGFQSLIEAYGVPTYTEINPGLYTCATFPFLFAVMFGDCGHGIIMFLFALLMVVKEKSWAPKVVHNEIAYMMFGGRYIILLMGAFSMYTGLIYNDIFSKSMNIFGSSFHVGPNTTQHILSEGHGEHSLNPGDPGDYIDQPYPIGLDPIWQLSVNKISFLNTYKMKVSVIVGVVHMLFGVMLSLFNHIHFKRFERIYCEFIPQIVFLVLLFGYLCFLCLFKWTYYGDGVAFAPENGSHCAPAILITFINMFLLKEDKPPAGCPSVYMFPGQSSIQKAFLLLALLSIPILLLPRAFILRARHNKKIRESVPTIVVVDDTSPITDSSVSVDNSESPQPLEEFELSEHLIHQGIHTIEFVLGCVSHTASYLRLWALSLAHAQLSEVLWNMVLQMGLKSSGYVGCVMLYFLFSAWAFLTVAILIVMEGLSAFLHTLRLHWVEFCSKFYEAQGYGFAPFSFKQIVCPAPND